MDFARARGSVKLLADAVGDAVNLAVLRHEFRLVDVVARVVGERRGIDELHRAAVGGRGVEVCGDGGGARRCVNALHGGRRLGIAAGGLVVEGYLLACRPRHIEHFLAAIGARGDGACLPAVVALRRKRGGQCDGVHGGLLRLRLVRRVVLAGARGGQCARRQQRHGHYQCLLRCHCHVLLVGLFPLVPYAACLGSAASSEWIVVVGCVVVAATHSVLTAREQRREVLKLNHPRRGLHVPPFNGVVFLYHILYGL